MAKRRYSRKSKKEKLEDQNAALKEEKEKQKEEENKRWKNSSCPYDKNMGEKFTLRKYNNNPFLPDPKSTNLSSDVPYPYRKSGGKNKKEIEEEEHRRVVHGMNLD